MKSNFFLQLIISTALVFSYNVHVVAAPTIAKAAAESRDEARAWAEDKGARLLTAFKDNDLERRYRTLDELFLSYVDMEYVSRFVAGRYWSTMTPEQQERYRALFNRYALALYKTFPLEFASRIKYNVTDVSPQEAFTIVTATVSVQLAENNPPQVFLIQFRLRRLDSELKLVDIKFAESSLILSYRGKFSEMISANDGDIEWFLEDLGDLAASLEKSNAVRLEKSVSVQETP